MSLLGDVVAVLRDDDIHHALIDAAALAVHGVSRSTVDIDLLTLDSRATDDPLAGIVRLSDASQVVDVVVGRGAWQRIVETAAVPDALWERISEVI